jgi:hypothetical protein
MILSSCDVRRLSDFVPRNGRGQGQELKEADKYIHEYELPY